jgi:hypothetical protein
MDIERTIDDIEQLEEMFEAPDIRPLNATDLAALNRRHDEMLAHSPWFRLWQRYGVCCRTESPAVLRLPGTGTKLPANGREKWRRKKLLISCRNSRRLNKTYFRTSKTDTSLKLIRSAATQFCGV